MKSPRRESSIKMVIDWFIFKNNQITLFTYLHTRNKYGTT